MFIHDYRPGAETMLQRYFNSLGGPAANPSDDERHHMARSSTPATQAQSSSSSPVLSPGLKEPIIWNFVIQLASAVRAVHNAGLACRVIHPSKILVTGKSRYVPVCVVRCVCVSVCLSVCLTLSVCLYLILHYTTCQLLPPDH